MRWLIIGARGQLGQELLSYLDALPHTTVVGTDLPECDVRLPTVLGPVIYAVKPEIVVNLAAFHEVDRCESDAESAFAVNAVGALNVARAAQAVEAKLIHLSTDYVFSGEGRDTPYHESDHPGPRSIYAASKFAGETLIATYAPQAAVIRSCGLYGGFTPRAKPNNIVQALLLAAREGKPLRVVDDQICTPTWTRPLAEAIWLAADRDLCGPVHASCRGACSWHAFAEKLFELAGVKADLKAVSSAEYGAKAKRPAYSVLDNAALRESGHDPFPTWEEALAEYLRMS